jgi:hypothetical protein
MEKKAVLAVAIISSCMVFGGITSYAQDGTTAKGGAIEAVSMTETTPKAPPSFKDKIQGILTPETVTTTGVKEHDVYIPQNTKIPLELTETISSKTLKQDQQFSLQTTENLIVNNVVVIPKGTACQAYVTKARKNGLFGRRGVLEFNIPSIKTLNNIDVPLNGYIKGAGKSDGGAVAVAAAVSLVGGLFMKGTNVSYPEGQIFITTVARNTDLEATNDTLPQVMDESKPQGNAITVQV